MLRSKAASTRDRQESTEPQAPAVTVAYEQVPLGGPVQATSVVYEGTDERHVALAATVAVPSSGIRPASAAGALPAGGGTLPLGGLFAAPAADAIDATLAAGSPDSFIVDTTAAVRSTLSRSAVLPRVEVAGAQVQLVLDPKARYEERRMLGAGGVGEVVEALDNDIGRTVALKRLLPEMRAPSALLRFVDEIRTIGGLEHPNIVPIHDVGVDAAGQYYFVMKYVQGETLESIIEKLAAGDLEYHRKYTFERRVQIFTGILEAIHYAHARGCIHRDIKPANVMVGPYGEVVVMDWGLAKKIGSPDATPASAPDARTGSGTGQEAVASSHASSSFGTAVGSILGTPAYMSPEQATGDSAVLDERSDVYSLCALLYELLTLHHYLGDEDRTVEQMLQAVVTEPPANALTVKSPHQGPIPADLYWFLVRGLQKNPAERYQSIAEMLDRLAQRRDGSIPIQCPITFTKQATNVWMRFVDRHPFLVMSGLSVGALLIAGTIVYTAVMLVL